MSQEISIYEAYLYEHKDEYTRNVLAGLILRLIIQAWGNWGNLNLIYAVYRNPGLQSCSGILLAITACANTFHQASHYFYTFLVVTKTNLIAVKYCVFINTLPNIGFHVGLLMVIFLAVDRLICVLFPVARRHISKRFFITIYLAITAAITVFFIAFGYYELFRLNPEQQVFCLLTDAMPGRAGKTWFFACLIGSLLALLCYLVIWILLRMNKQKDSGTARMFKSLFTICIVISTCWFLIGILFVYVTVTDVPVLDAWYFRYNLGVAINIACSCNYYILWFCSKEYKSAFKNQLFCFRNKTTPVEITIVKGLNSSTNNPIQFTVKSY